MIRALALVAFCACHGNLPTCADPCSNPGDTRCSDSGHVQTCTQQTASCVQWGPSAACQAGEICIDNACNDECQTDPIASVCNQAAAQITSCCGPTFGAAELCHNALTAGHDPIADCTAQAAATCAALHDQVKAQNVCCCGAGQTCDYQTSNWQCVKKCTSSADCASETGRPSCAPNLDPTTSVSFSPDLCKPQDASLYDGCSNTDPCTTGECYADSNSNLFCAAACVVDSDCGNISQACCLLTDARPLRASGKACAPCTIAGSR